MPEIQIRPVTAADIPSLVAMDHCCFSEFAWQLEVRKRQEGSPSGSAIDVRFRQVRLPRPVRIEYPRPASDLAKEWSERAGVLAAVLDRQTVGYISLARQFAPAVAWVTDLVVDTPHRRKGIATAMLLAALEWSDGQAIHNLLLEMQPKNHPAIQLAIKLGFEFCGYNDRHYLNHEIGIFFAKPLRP